MIGTWGGGADGITLLLFEQISQIALEKSNQYQISWWTVVTNAPLIVNSQCTVTNQSLYGSCFYRLAIIAAPILHAQISEPNIFLAWPSSAQNYSLQTTPNLAYPNSWLTLKNAPVVMNLQNIVTNPVVGGKQSSFD